MQQTLVAHESDSISHKLVKGQEEVHHQKLNPNTHEARPQIETNMKGVYLARAQFGIRDITVFQVRVPTQVLNRHKNGTIVMHKNEQK